MTVHVHLDALFEQYPHLLSCRGSVEKAFALWCEVYRRGRKTLVCGNGGSAADSEHIVGELMKGFLKRRPLDSDLKRRLQEAYGEDGTYASARLQQALPAISLVAHTSLLSAVMNDVSADLVFAQQVMGYGCADDALVALSTSGQSRNVVLALQAAQCLGLTTIGFSGGSGGTMDALCDVCIVVPGSCTTAIQEQHVAVYHGLCAQLEEEFFAQ